MRGVIIMKKYNIGFIGAGKMASAIIKGLLKTGFNSENIMATQAEKEGLEEKTGWIGASHNPVITIKENGVLLTVDLEKGQKTGYFLDQKFNRKIVGGFAKGKTVLDTFTHTGAFALNCALAGAKEVTAVDISSEAVETVNNNIKINNQQKFVSIKQKIACILF
jgi:23S rRNA (cytosine1962-C5)-methyltransferase